MRVVTPKAMEEGAKLPGKAGVRVKLKVPEKLKGKVWVRARTRGMVKLKGKVWLRARARVMLMAMVKLLEGEVMERSRGMVGAMVRETTVRHSLLAQVVEGPALKDCHLGEPAQAWGTGWPHCLAGERAAAQGWAGAIVTAARWGWAGAGEACQGWVRLDSAQVTPVAERIAAQRCSLAEGAAAQATPVAERVAAQRCSLAEGAAAQGWGKAPGVWDCSEGATAGGGLQEVGFAWGCQMVGETAAGGMAQVLAQRGWLEAVVVTVLAGGGWATPVLG